MAHTIYARVLHAATAARMKFFCVACNWSPPKEAKIASMTELTLDCFPIYARLLYDTMSLTAGPRKNFGVKHFHSAIRPAPCGHW